jgi:hypothetical protein
MDFYKLLDNQSKHIPQRQIQELERISSKVEDKKYPYRNTANRSVGEYPPTMNDRIKVIIFLIKFNLGFRIFKR